MTESGYAWRARGLAGDEAWWLRPREWAGDELGEDDHLEERIYSIFATTWHEPDPRWTKLRGILRNEWHGTQSPGPWRVLRVGMLGDADPEIVDRVVAVVREIRDEAREGRELSKEGTIEAVAKMWGVDGRTIDWTPEGDARAKAALVPQDEQRYAGPEWEVALRIYTRWTSTAQEVDEPNAFARTLHPSAQINATGPGSAAIAVALAAIRITGTVRPHDCGPCPREICWVDLNAGSPPSHRSRPGKGEDRGRPR